MSLRLQDAGGSGHPIRASKNKNEPGLRTSGKRPPCPDPGGKTAASGLPKKKRRPDSEKKTRDLREKTAASGLRKKTASSGLVVRDPAARAPAAPVRPLPPACSDRIPSRRPAEITSRGRVRRRPAEGPVTAPRIRLCCRLDSDAPRTPALPPSLPRAPSRHARRERRRRRRPGGCLNPCGSGGGRATCGCRSACGGAPGQPAPRRGSDGGGE